LRAAAHRGDFLDVIKAVVWREEGDEREIVRDALAATAVGPHQHLRSISTST
jgi:hypothetical protein